MKHTDQATTTRDRIQRLCDPGSFSPFQPASGAGFHLGAATVDDRPVRIIAADVDAPLRMTALEAFARLSAFLDQIKRDPAPVVQLLDVQADLRAATGKTLIPPGGLELLADARGMGAVYGGLARLDGVAPRIAVLLGPTGASRSFPAALADATVMLEDASLCLGRPDAVRRMIGQTTDFARLGGPAVHAEISGTVHKVARTEEGALAWARRWLALLPTRAGEAPPTAQPREPRENIEAAGRILQAGLNAPVDMHAVLDALVDGGSWLEMGDRHAAECLTGLARVQGRTLGLVANNAAVRGGILYPETCRKMTRFIRFCSAFGLPVAFLADTPGFMVGEDVERRGIVQAAADLYTAIAACSGPTLCVVVRKAYSAGLYAMAGPGVGDAFRVMPGASVSIFGPEALRRFRDGQNEDGFGADALDAMMQAALDPQVLVEKSLVERVTDWGDLRADLADCARRQSNKTC